MADEWRRYLEQQIELGGSELVLSGAAGRRGREAKQQADMARNHQPSSQTVSKSPPAEKQPQTAREEKAGSQPHGMAESSQLPRGPAAPLPRWLQGAPPIPGPGLAVESPERHLLDEDQLATLTSLDQIAERIRGCRSCGLCSGRINAVPGEGSPTARMVLIGEGPGATEDAQGRPFVGQAGALLDGILEAIEVPRDSVYITNIVKCRPPQNRKPLPDEIAACMPYMHRQLELLRPKVIVALGGTAGEALLGVRKSLGELRGKVHTYNGIPLIVTYHPAALLRNPNWKKPTWDDIRIARQLLAR